MRAFVVADAHARWDLVKGLLDKARVKDEEAILVQLGDLANCVKDDVIEDVECLSKAGVVFDVLLVGNHEYPYWKGPLFAGFHSHRAVEDILLRHYDRASRHRAAFSFGGVLVTHAGVGSQFAHRFVGMNAASIATSLNSKWDYDPRHPLFSSIGYSRGGSDPYGGILWANWDEPKLDTIPQLVGHTPGREMRERENATCIDLGGCKGGDGYARGDRIMGAWISRDGEIEIVEYNA